MRKNIQFMTAGVSVLLLAMAAGCASDASPQASTEGAPSAAYPWIGATFTAADLAKE